MKKILILEPDNKTAKIVRDGLKGLDLEIIIASDAQEAISIADKIKPDVVMIELATPDQNGVAFLQEYRSYPEWRDTPVIVHSMLNLDKLATTKLKQDYRVNEYLYKPSTTIENLRSTINNI